MVTAWATNISWEAREWKKGQGEWVNRRGPICGAISITPRTTVSIASTRRYSSSMDGTISCPFREPCGCSLACGDWDAPANLLFTKVRSTELVNGRETTKWILLSAYWNSSSVTYEPSTFADVVAKRPV